jgi:hypothetical protein
MKQKKKLSRLIRVERKRSDGKLAIISGLGKKQNNSALPSSCSFTDRHSGINLTSTMHLARLQPAFNLPLTSVQPAFNLFSTCL